MVLQIRRTLLENYGKAKRVIAKAKRTIVEEYDIISWLLRIFLGGTINIGILNAANAYLLSYWSTISLYQDLSRAGFIIAAGIMPFILSLILTSSRPRLRIVPPSYIVAVSWAWLFVVWVNPPDITQVPNIIMFGLLYLSVGILEDKAATLILGIATERENIYYEHRKVYAEINDIKARLTRPEIREGLHLSEQVEGNAEQGYQFKTESGFGLQNMIFLSRDKEPEVTNLKIVYYVQGRYSLRVSPNFLEESRKLSLYLTDVLYGRDLKMGFEVVVPFTNTAHDTLIDKVVDEMQGYYARSKQLSNVDRFKIVTAVVVGVLTIVLYLIEQPLYAGIAIAIEVLLTVSQLPDIIRKQR